MGYEAELLSQINRNCKEFLPYAPLSDYNVFHTLGIFASMKLLCTFTPKKYLFSDNIHPFLFFPYIPLCF